MLAKVSFHLVQKNQLLTMILSW